MSLVREELDRHHRTLKQRRGWLRKLLRPLPRRANVARYPVIKWFAVMARRLPFLWSFRRQHVLPALYLGCVLSLLPVYGIQFGLALVFALLVRGNVTVLMGLQLLTNPLTVVPAYGLTYRVGLAALELFGWSKPVAWQACFRFVTGGDASEVPVDTCVYAFLLGGVVVGLAFAVLAHVTWLLAAWEVRRVRARIAYLREALAAEAAGLPPPPKP
ncbi:MAG: hypothetical protein COZ47_02690 [Lysobacterales bacterium CG_4_10_14_3_um_filter_64_11]|nr:MAG: hypothetical protein COZ47_02690 [Xanthomonadales bacterium CG_4_10_14_3_um_filter_64_11]